MRPADSEEWQNVGEGRPEGRDLRQGLPGADRVHRAPELRHRQVDRRDPRRAQGQEQWLHQGAVLLQGAPASFLLLQFLFVYKMTFVDVLYDITLWFWY